MPRYHAQEGQIYMSTTGSGTAVPLGGGAAWTLSLTRARVEVEAFGDPNINRVQGRPDTQGTFRFWFDDTVETQFDAAESADGCKIYLYPDAANANTKYWYGPAFVDISDISAENTGAVGGNGSFVANGAWGRM